MKYTFIIFTIAILIVVGCQPKAAPAAEASLKISLSTICGWCTGGDSLVIDSHQTVYIHYASCDKTKGTQKTVATDPQLWQALTSLLQPDKFNNTHLNICNVCADGCDIRATIKDKNYEHSISYGKNSNPAVAAIRPFLQKLDSVRISYKKQYIQ